MRYTDPREVLNLAKTIGSDMQEMAQLCDDLRGDLNRLEESFHDDEINSIDEILTQIEAIISSNMEETRTVLKGLKQFAEQLIKIRNLSR